MSHSARDLRGLLIDNRFRIERRLGDGGAGTVWEALHVHSLQRVALKTLHDDLALEPTVLARFLREARAAAALRTRHVVRIVDAHMDYVHDGRPLPFLVMEYLEGFTLEQALRGGPLRPGQARWVAAQLGSALRLCHENGIVHRDLKPGNVFLTTDEDERPLVKLCDFGIAKLLDTAPFSGDPATHTGMVLGTPMYMAPEQLRAAKDGGPAIDQWALAHIVFKMLAGSEYFARVSTGAELIAAILSEELARPSRLATGLPRGFDAWFLRSCEREPARRWPNVSAQVEALGSALDDPSPEPFTVDSRLESQIRSEAFASAPRERPKRALRPFSDVRTWLIALATLGMLAVMWRVRGHLQTRWDAPAEPMVVAAPEPTVVRASPPPAPPAPPESAITAPAPTPPVVQSEHGREGTAAHRSRAAVAAPVLSSPSHAAPPAAATRLPAGAFCSRSSQCISGLCVAEACQ